MKRGPLDILIVGGGGREHAIAWSLRRSPRTGSLYCAPGNAGIAALAECVDVAATDLDGQVALAREKAVDLVIVAPDDPLAMGLVDRLEAAGIPAFGPRRAAARIEASKSFAKDLMRKAGIPTADFVTFDDPLEALSHVSACPLPVVVKADGLALGKGVRICHVREEAVQAVADMMQQEAFGQAGRRVVVESFMTGPELTVLAFSDGRTVVPMVSSRDHKRAFDGDQGPNTGGMGAIAPGACLSPAQEKDLADRIFQPTIDALREMGSEFRGVLYFGLMLTPDGPRVVEYNARFGDPEAQAVLPLLETDLVDVVEAVLEGRLASCDIRWSGRSSCCVVLASGGYPGSYRKGLPIGGLESLEGMQDVLVFHAGTRRDGDGQVVTAGGRVLGVTAVANDLDSAIDRAYEACESIRFEGRMMRRDIGRTHP